MASTLHKVYGVSPDVVVFIQDLTSFIFTILQNFGLFSNLEMLIERTHGLHCVTKVRIKDRKVTYSSPQGSLIIGSSWLRHI
jgi:hypothetical protein